MALEHIDPAELDPQKTIVVATGNAHKLTEIEAILGAALPGTRFVAVGQLGDFEDPEEGRKLVRQVILKNHDSLPMGEFAIGVNPYVTSPMLDILFDEKISGSIHFTPGCCYDDAYNGNKSSVHWDMVLIQTPEYGGGEIWFDGKLIRKDGLFVVDELLPLNPENLR